jgi:hypothetical protein
MTTATLSVDSKHVFRSIGAVLAGLIANVVLSSATDMALIAAGVFPPFSEFTRHTDATLLLALLYRTLFGIYGCYLAARLAPNRPMKHALVLGGIGFAIGAIGTVAMWDPATAWYSIAVAVVALPAAWIGGRLYEKRLAGNAA